MPFLFSDNSRNLGLSSSKKMRATQCQDALSKSLDSFPTYIFFFTSSFTEAKAMRQAAGAAVVP